MTHGLIYEEKNISFSEIFTGYLSDIRLEIEAIKLKTLRKDMCGINVHLERLETALFGIEDAKLELAEKYYHS